MIIEGPSPAHPERMNVFVEAGSFDECQASVMEVMDRVGTATFTIPAKGASGRFMAFGHYPREVVHVDR